MRITMMQAEMLKLHLPHISPHLPHISPISPHLTLQAEMLELHLPHISPYLPHISPISPHLTLQAEMLELRAAPDGPAEGTVLAEIWGDMGRYGEIWGDMGTVLAEMLCSLHSQPITSGAASTLPRASSPPRADQPPHGRAGHISPYLPISPHTAVQAIS